MLRRFLFPPNFLKFGRKGRMDFLRTRLFMKTLTRYLGLIFKLLVFLLVLGFALKNSQTVIFYSYLDYVWQAPLIVMLGLAFVLGALTGVLALLPTLFRLRHENSRQTKATQADTVMPTDFPVV
jgi:putative membrane protein